IRSLRSRRATRRPERSKNERNSATSSSANRDGLVAKIALGRGLSILIVIWRPLPSFRVRANNSSRPDGQHDGTGVWATPRRTDVNAASANVTGLPVIIVGCRSVDVGHFGA